MHHKENNICLDNINVSIVLTDLLLVSSANATEAMNRGFNIDHEEVLELIVSVNRRLKRVKSALQPLN